MSALQYFDLMDEIFLYHSKFLQDNNYGSRTMLFMELMAYRGKLQKELMYFLSWLISNNGKK